MTLLLDAHTFLSLRWDDAHLSSVELSIGACGITRLW